MLLPVRRSEACSRVPAALQAAQSWQKDGVADPVSSWKREAGKVDTALSVKLTWPMTFEGLTCCLRFLLGCASCSVAPAQCCCKLQRTSARYYAGVEGLILL